MAHTLILTQIQDGPSDVIYTLYAESDGMSGELVNFPLIDPDWLTTGQNGEPYVPPGVPAGRCFSIQQLLYNFQGFAATLSFDSASPLPVWLMAPSTDSYNDFRPLGGLADRTPISSVPNGTVFLSTKGFASLGSTGCLMIKVKKMKP